MTELQKAERDAFEKWYAHHIDLHERSARAAFEAGRSAREQELATLAQKVTTIVFEQLDRNCEWLVGENHAVGLVRAALKEPS